MNIQKDGTALLSTGSSRIVHRDQWSVIVESTGLAWNGDQVTFRVSFSMGELAMLSRALVAQRKADREPEADPQYSRQLGGRS
jgi:hypothetical protein